MKTLNKSLIKLEFQILSSVFVCVFFYFSDEFISKGVFDFNMPLFWYWNEKKMKILEKLFLCVLHLLWKSNLINFQFSFKISLKMTSFSYIFTWLNSFFSTYWISNFLTYFPLLFSIFNFLTKKMEIYIIPIITSNITSMKMEL